MGTFQNTLGLLTLFSAVLPTSAVAAETVATRPVFSQAEFISGPGEGYVGAIQAPDGLFTMAWSDYESLLSLSIRWKTGVRELHPLADENRMDLDFALVGDEVWGLGYLRKIVTYRWSERSFGQIPLEGVPMRITSAATRAFVLVKEVFEPTRVIEINTLSRQPERQWSFESESPQDIAASSDRLYVLSTAPNSDPTEGAPSVWSLIHEVDLQSGEKKEILRTSVPLSELHHDSGRLWLLSGERVLIWDPSSPFTDLSYFNLPKYSHGPLSVHQGSIFVPCWRGESQFACEVHPAPQARIKKVALGHGIYSWIRFYGGRFYALPFDEGQSISIDVFDHDGTRLKPIDLPPGISPRDLEFHQDVLYFGSCWDSDCPREKRGVFAYSLKEGSLHQVGDLRNVPVGLIAIRGNQAFVLQIGESPAIVEYEISMYSYSWIPKQAYSTMLFDQLKLSNSRVSLAVSPSHLTLQGTVNGQFRQGKLIRIDRESGRTEAIIVPNPDPNDLVPGVKDLYSASFDIQAHPDFYRLDPESGRWSSYQLEASPSSFSWADDGLWVFSRDGDWNHFATLIEGLE